MYLNNALVFIFFKNKYNTLYFAFVTPNVIIYKHNEYYAKTLQQNTTKFCTYSYIIFFNKLYFSVATSHKILFLCSCKSGLSCTKDSFLKCDWLKLSFVLD